MKTSIEVADREEAALFRRGLQEADCRAFVKIVGALVDRPKREQARTLAYIHDLVTDPESRFGSDANG